MKFYDASKPLYPQTVASGIGLGTGLLQEREGMNCGHDKVPHSATLCLIAFTSKSLSSVEQQYSCIEWEALGMFHRLEKLTIMLF